MESTASYVEDVKDDLSETSKAILLELGMLESYGALSKELNPVRQGGEA